MASGHSKKEAEDYDKALERLMKDCLPPILVEVVERRPPDPITYIAECLYKYRAQEDADVMSSLQPSTHMAKVSRVSTQSSALTETTSHTNKVQESTAHSYHVNIVHVNDDSVDPLDDIELHEPRNLGPNHLHEHCITVLNSMDFFDDDDFS